MKHNRFNIISFILVIILIAGCKKDNKPNDNNVVNDNHVINDNKQYYNDFTPDLTLNLNDSLSVDVDGNGSKDVIFKINSGGIWIDRNNSDCLLSIGIFIGSGSSNIDTIGFNETINDFQNWYSGFCLFTNKIGYVGIKKVLNGNTTYGWIKIVIGDKSLIIEKLYFGKDSGITIKAGVKDY